MHRAKRLSKSAKGRRLRKSTDLRLRKSFFARQNRALGDSAIESGQGDVKVFMNERKWNAAIFLIVLFSLWVTACGKWADAGDYEEEPESVAGDVAEERNEIEEMSFGNMEEESEVDVATEGNATEAEIKEDVPTEDAAGESGAEDVTEKAADESADESEAELPENVIMAYLTENIEYSDAVMPVQYVDELSLLTDMKYTDGTYVYQDGKVYYRRYHEDSYEETALWGSYEPVPETEKEIVCIDADGVETVLFTDEGYGDIYLVDGRFYMTDGKLCEENGSVRIEKRLYSVDMQGKDRIDYGNGKIFAIDKERRIMILKMVEESAACYYAMNYETGEKKLILTEKEDGYLNYPDIYQDGWLYYERLMPDDFWIFRLCAVSVEGEQREIMAFTSALNQNYNGYRESILNIKVDGERIYFIIGGYDGSASEFQGGKLVSINLDGTDYKAVETKGDAYYISHDNGKILVYFPRSYRPVADFVEECDTTVWDMDSAICYPSDFPQKILLAYEQQKSQMWQYDPSEKGTLCELSLNWDEIEEKKVDIYAVPDASGKIVRVAMNLGERIAKYENGEVDQIQYKDLYYADGFLYFTVEYSVYDKEASIGWRDGYRRLRSDVYRLNVGESAARLLYSY